MTLLLEYNQKKITCLNKQLVDSISNVIQRKLGPVERPRGSVVEEELGDAIDSVGNLHSRRGEAVGEARILGDDADALGRLPLVLRPEDDGAQGIVRDEEHRVLVEGGQVGAVEAAADGLGAVLEGHADGLALFGGRVEAEQLAALAVADEHAGAVVEGRDAGEAVHRLVGAALDEPGLGRLAVGANLDDTAGKRADDEAVAGRVVLHVLEAAKDALGHGRQVLLPLDPARREVVLHNQVGARDVDALRVKGRAGVGADGELVVALVDLHARDVERGHVGDAGEGDDVGDAVLDGVVHGNGALVEVAGADGWSVLVLGQS